MKGKINLSFFKDILYSDAYSEACSTKRDSHLKGKRAKKVPVEFL